MELKPNFERLKTAINHQEADRVPFFEALSNQMNLSLGYPMFTLSQEAYCRDNQKGPEILRLT